MGDNIEKTMKDELQAIAFFALAMDENTGITDTARLAIHLRGNLQF